MLEVDRFNLSCAYSLLEKCAKGYENFEFYKVYQEIYQFCILNMSNFYLDILKDRLYTARKDGLSRRSAQTALYRIMIILVKAVAPILPFYRGGALAASKIKGGRKRASVGLAAGK